MTISAKADTAKTIQGATVTVTVTVGGTASADTTVTIGGVTPTITAVSGTGVTKVSDTQFKVASGTTSGTVTFTYTAGASYTAPTFTA